MKWINAKEQLPKLGECVLVNFTGSKYVDVAVLKNTNEVLQQFKPDQYPDKLAWIFKDGSFGEKPLESVECWMPFPEVPKKD